MQPACARGYSLPTFGYLTDTVVNQSQSVRPIHNHRFVPCAAGRSGPSLVLSVG
jgi:hypothetical protein